MELIGVPHHITGPHTKKCVCADSRSVAYQANLDHKTGKQNG